MLYKFLLVILFFSFGGYEGFCQYSKMVNPAHEAYQDSLKKMNYTYTFPILGKQAYKRGYDIPYPWGISTIYFTQRQEIIISSTNIGFNGGRQ